MHSAINKTMFLRCTDEVWNKGTYSVIPEIIAPEFVYHHFLMGELKGPEGFKKHVSGIRAAFPDYHMTITDIVAERDTVAIRYFFTGINTGSLMGIPPTGRKVKMDGAVFVRYEHGMAVEEFAFVDSASLMQQLGIGTPVFQTQRAVPAP